MASPGSRSATPRALSTTTPGASLAFAAAGGGGGGSGSVVGGQLVAPADATTGVVAWPPMVIRLPLAAGGGASVALRVTCTRPAADGDAAPPLDVNTTTTAVSLRVCVPPAATGPQQTPLPPFQFGIALGADAEGWDDPCGGHVGGWVPPVACSITLVSAALGESDATNDTSSVSVFLQHAMTAMDLATHTVGFDAFTLTAPQDAMYELVATCMMDDLAVPAPYRFTVAQAGCDVGMAPTGVTCSRCGGNQFSLGGRGGSCTGCPPVGATCTNGILTLLPHYYRPPAHAAAPLGPSTELYACYNADACTLNASAAAYGCAPGYGGPLCGVCDAVGGYANFGQACSKCWPAAVSVGFVVVVVVVVFLLLTRIALRKSSGRSEASIVLRITLSFIQAAGSLRVFRAGGTTAYHSVMGWTDVVSASPLSVGVLQCVAAPPYLVQYATTVSAPALAAAAVITIFLAATTVRAVRCRPRPTCDVAGWRGALAGWWHSKRHLSTLLFVLSLAYMPIVSASLRALDCIDPVAGIQYLRSDLSVECGVGQHAAARALAYTVLVVVGVGFPAGLAWLLGTATQAQLLDDGFHATWGFLFDGYRSPSWQPASPGADDGGGAKVTPPPSPSPAVPSIARRASRLLTGVSPTSTGTSSRFTVGGMLAAHAAGLPTAAGGGTNDLRRRQHRRRSTLAARLAQPWQVVGHSRVWWEGVVLVRKAGVVLLAVLLTNPYLQCVGAALWFLAFLALQLRYAPYTKRLFNTLEAGALTACLLTAVVSCALLQYNAGVTSAELHPPGAMTGIEWAATVALLALNLGTFIGLAGLWLSMQCRRVRQLVQARLVTMRGRGAAANDAKSTLPPLLPPLLTRHAVGGGRGSLLMDVPNPLLRTHGNAHSSTGVSIASPGTTTMATSPRRARVELTPIPSRAAAR